MAKASAPGDPLTQGDASGPGPASESVLRRTMVAVVFGGLMSMLDTTIVNIAIRTLSVRLHADLASVQWVVTGYLLALAAALPLAGWLADRFGARQVYVASIATFTLASLACGLSTSLSQLIGFRVLQGVAGALTMPVGQMILVPVAGRARMARVMGTLSIPIVMAPIFGPVLGGLLLEHAGWQWIFFVNLPVGLVAVPLALWLLPRDQPRRAARPDFPGLLLISAGSVAATYGLASAGGQAIRVWLPLVLGVALLAAFVVRSGRIDRPLLDVRLYRNRAYAASSLVNFALGGIVFGGMILLPLYFQSVRLQDPVMTGLLIAPTGVGIAITAPLASRLTDRFGSGRTALAGAMINAIGTVPLVFLGGSTPYLWLSAVMLVRGIGISLCMIPAMSAIYRAIPPAKVGDGTTQANVLNRLGGSTGTAVFTIVLTHAIASAGPSGAAYGEAFRWVLGAGALMAVPAIFLARAESRAAADAVHTGGTDASGHQAGSAASGRTEEPAATGTTAERSAAS
jgi:EmrB/QacA subfamily drug resistance transporter